MARQRGLWKKLEILSHGTDNTQKTQSLKGKEEKEMKRETVISLVENLFYLVAGVLAIVLHQMATNYANSVRPYSGAIGGEIFVPILVYGICFFVIKNTAELLRNFDFKPSRKKEFKNYKSLQAQAKIKKNGTVIVYNRDGSKQKFSDFGSFIESMK